MIKGDFDYKSFAKSMKEQSQDLIPDDFSKDNAKYLADTIYNFVLLSGEALYNDSEFVLSEENAIMICQLIAEWTFAKIEELVKLNVSQKKWDVILQQIAFVVFEASKQAVKKDIPQTDIIKAVEEHAEKVWEKCINDVESKAPETDEDEESDFDYSDLHINHSDYYNEKANQLEEIYKIPFIQQDKSGFLFKLTEMGLNIKNSLHSFGKTNKSLYYIGGAALLISLILKIYLHNNNGSAVQYVNGALFLFAYIAIGYVVYRIVVNFRERIELKNQEKELEKIQNDLKELVNPDRMYERLGVDEVCISVGQNLLSIADPDQDGTLLARVAALRQRLTDQLGYIIPSVRIMDCSNIEYNEYVISIRNNEVASGFVYPGMCMVNADKWDSVCDKIPEKAIIGVEPVEQVQVYWVTKNDLNEVDNIASKKPEKVIIDHLSEMLIRNVNEIMTISSVQKLIDYVRNENEKLVNDMFANGIKEYDLQKIFINLIREKVSIKDILFIFEKLCDLSRFTTDTDILTEKLRTVLGRSICSDITERGRVLYAAKLSEELENLLKQSIKKEGNLTVLNLSPEFEQELIQTVVLKLLEIRKNFEQKPVILCKPENRLPLYRLLEAKIPSIQVLSYAELTPEILTEELGEIECPSKNNE